jgi:hypothetical protein
MSAEKQKKSEEKTLNEFFELLGIFIGNLDAHCEPVSEYADKYSEGLPDFYLKSKKEGCPDLAIEIKTLQRDYDRFASYEKPFEFKKHNLVIENFHINIELNLPNYADFSPKSIKKHWDNLNLEKEFSKHREKWKDIFNRDIKEGLEYIRKFLEDYFSEKLGKDCPLTSCVIKVNPRREGKNQFIFIVCFHKMWESENINFHIEKIKENVEESKKKFEKLRKIKSDKSDKSPHLELLLIEGMLVVYETFNSLIEELDKELNKELTQKGYKYLLFPVNNSNGKYYLMIRMNKEIEDSEESK